MLIRLIFIFSASFIYGNLPAQRIITGKVLNKNSRLPVPGVTISVFQGTQFAISNDRGYFQMTISEDDSLMLTHPDYMSGGLKPPEDDVFAVYIEQYNYYPSYQEGSLALYKYLQTNLKYPSRARLKEIDGYLFVEVLLDSTGQIVVCNALNSLCKNCELKILEVFMGIPGAWTPFEEQLAKRIIFPIELRLGKEQPPTERLTEIRLPEGKLMDKIIILPF
jgi:hypothetical protein